MSRYTNYLRIVTKSEDGKTFIINVPELPGCSAQGCSLEDAIENADIAIDKWLEKAKQEGKTIPQGDTTGMNMSEVAYTALEKMCDENDAEHSVSEDEINIRAVNDGDVELVGNLYVDAFGYYREMLKVYSGFNRYVQFCINQKHSYIIEENGKPCGVVLAYEHPDMYEGISLYVELLAVFPDYQNRGYGDRLLKKVEENAKENSISEVSLRTGCYMDSYGFYRKRGYKDQKSDSRFLTKHIDLNNAV